MSANFTVGWVRELWKGKGKTAVNDAGFCSPSRPQTRSIVGRGKKSAPIPLWGVRELGRWGAAVGRNCSEQCRLLFSE